MLPESVFEGCESQHFFNSHINFIFLFIYVLFILQWSFILISTVLYSLVTSPYFLINTYQRFSALCPQKQMK